jgi:hypothetical protein
MAGFITSMRAMTLSRIAWVMLVSFCRNHVQNAQDKIAQTRKDAEVWISASPRLERRGRECRPLVLALAGLGFCTAKTS